MSMPSFHGAGGARTVKLTANLIRRGFNMAGTSNCDLFILVICSPPEAGVRSYLQHTLHEGAYRPV